MRTYNILIPERMNTMYLNGELKIFIDKYYSLKPHLKLIEDNCQIKEISKRQKKPYTFLDDITSQYAKQSLNRKCCKQN